jgi:hypothetical protein
MTRSSVAASGSLSKLTRRTFAAAGAIFALAGPRMARAATEVDLMLVLAVDASGSVSQRRFELQKQGYAAAFRNPRVLKAIQSLMTQSIGVTMFQWTGPRLQVPVVPWTQVKDAATAEDFAGAIERVPRQLFGGGTSISGAIDFGRLILLQIARDEAVKDGITINGLPILAVEPDLDTYYFENVIGGPGAVMVPAESFESFADAILKKLIIEIATDDVGAVPVPLP